MQDLAWAGFILAAAAAFGLWQQWGLVRLSWTGGLEAHLQQQRQERRRTEFQGVKTLSLKQAYEIFQQGQARFIDARPADEYAELHVPGAINLSPEDLKEGKVSPLSGTPKDQQLVVYCGQVTCDAALTVAERLQSMGYTKVAAFLGGFREWDEAGFPADTSK